MRTWLDWWVLLAARDWTSSPIETGGAISGCLMGNPKKSNFYVHGQCYGTYLKFLDADRVDFVLLNRQTPDARLRISRSIDNDGSLAAK